MSVRVSHCQHAAVTRKPSNANSLEAAFQLSIPLPLRFLSDLECLCNGCGDPAVVTYDGRVKMITAEQKTLLSRWTADKNDVCKFQVRVVTRADIGGQESALHCDWLGFAFGATSNPDKFSKNFLFAQDVDGKGVVAIRGVGYQEPCIIDVSTPYLYCLGDCTWVVTKIDDHHFTLRSDCCPYAMDWLPNGEDTYWQLWVSDGTKYKDDMMEGMCGNCNDEAYDDWVLCTDCATILPMTNASLQAISDSCREGDNQGGSFNGGTKLDGAPNCS